MAVRALLSLLLIANLVLAPASRAAAAGLAGESAPGRAPTVTAAPDEPESDEPAPDEPVPDEPAPGEPAPAPADSDASLPPLPAAVFEQVVTGKRDAEDPFRADRSISVVGHRDLAEQTPRTVPEALWDAPGVFVQQTNHGGGSPIVRGMIGPQVLLLVDGVRLSNSVYRTGPLQYLNLVDPLNLERLEVLRGPGAVLYGSDAMGGVIQAFPLQPRDFRASPGFDGGGHVLLRLASADEGIAGHAHFDAGSGGLSAFGGATYQRSGDLRAGGRGETQPYSGYDRLSAAGQVDYRFSEGFFEDWRVKAAYLFTDIVDAGRTDKLWDRNSLQLYDNRDHLAYVRLEPRIKVLDAQSRLTVSYQGFHERKDSFTVADDLATRLRGTRDDTDVHTVGIDLNVVKGILDRRLRLRKGGHYYRDMVGADRQTWAQGGTWTAVADQAYPDDSVYQNYGVYLLVEGDPVRTDDGHVLTLGGGYRFHGMAGSAPTTDALPSVDFSHLGHVGLASVQYRYADWVNLAVTWSQGFRAPNLQEAVMLGDSGKYFHVPNDDLAPEQANTLELLARAGLGRLRLGITGYVTWLEDLIKREPTTWEGQAEIDGKDVYENVNGREGFLWGLEAQAHLDIGWGISAAGHLTHTWGEESISDGPDLPLTRIPPLFGLLKLRYDGGARGDDWTWFIETYLRGAADQDRLSAEDESDVRIPDGGTTGWVTWNWRAGVTAYDLLRLGFTVENLLDERYKYHGSGLYAPGTNVILSAEAWY